MTAPQHPGPKCAEQVWTHLLPDGSYANRGLLRPCANRARYEAYDPQVPSNGWTPLCGMHANAGRWAGYAGLQWREVPR